MSFSPCETHLAVGDIGGGVCVIPCQSVEETQSDGEADLDTHFEDEVTDKALVKPPVYFTSVS